MCVGVCYLARQAIEKRRKEENINAKNDTKLNELEAANQELASQCMMDKRALIDLREELVKEKVAAEKLSGQIDIMSSQLAGVGISLKHDGSLSGIDNIQRMKQEVIKVANEAEARSQHPPQPVQPSSQDSSQPMFQRENTATMSCRSYL